MRDEGGCSSWNSRAGENEDDPERRFQRNILKMGSLFPLSPMKNCSGIKFTVSSTSKTVIKTPNRLRIHEARFKEGREPFTVSDL